MKINMTGDTLFAALHDAASDAAAAAAAAAAAKPWYNEVVTDPLEIGHLQNRGWDKLTPVQAAAAAVKAHREAEKFVGAPADKIIRLPNETTDEAGWNNVWQKLGAPKDPKEYDTALATVKYANGTVLDKAVADNVRALAAKNHWTVQTTTEVAQSLAKQVDGTRTNTDAEVQAKLAVEKTELAKNWGANAEVNRLIAANAATKLGIPPEAVATLEKSVGYKSVMEMFLKIGQSIGEDKFINALGGNNGGVLTKEQAVARVAELKADPAWSKRYLDGGAVERRDLEALLRIQTAT